MSLHCPTDEATRKAARSGSPAAWLLGALAVTLLLSGCASVPFAWMPFRHGEGKAPKANSCNKPQLYEQAQGVAPLRVPAGLDAPNTRGALKIPELHEPEAPRQLTDACRDEPPKYSNAQLLPTGKESKREKRAKSKAKKDAPVAPLAAPAPAAAPVVPAAAAPAAPAP
jgi:hypothetical protein